MGLKRGDVVIVALSGDYGKPRPAVVLETDRLAPTDHVLICPGTSHFREDVGQRRVSVDPTEGNGLRDLTQFQIDKMTIIRRSKCRIIGRLDRVAMERVNELIVLVLGLAD